MERDILEQIKEATREISISSLLTIQWEKTIVSLSTDRSIYTCETDVSCPNGVVHLFYFTELDGPYGSRYPSRFYCAGKVIYC